MHNDGFNIGWVILLLNYLNNTEEGDRKNSGGQKDTTEKPIVGHVVVDQEFRD